MQTLALRFHDDGCPRQRAEQRESAAATRALQVSRRTLPDLLGHLLQLARHAPLGRVHCEQPPPPLAATLLHTLGRRVRIEVYANCWPRPGQRCPLPTAYWRFPTPAVAAAWHSLGVEPAQSSVTPPAEPGPAEAEPDPFLPVGWRGTKPGAAREACWRRILWAGPLSPDSGARTAIWAFDILALMRPATQLVVVGEGEEEAQLRRFAAGMPCRDRISFRPELNEDTWTGVDLAWINDSSCAIPDAWLAARELGRNCLVAKPHAATGWGGPVAALPPHDPPSWARATSQWLDTAAAA